MLIPISCKTEALKILIQSCSKNSIAPTQVKLNIPQLTLGELAQLDGHGTVNTKILV